MRYLEVKGKLGKYRVNIWPHGMCELKDPRGYIYIRRANILQVMRELEVRETEVFNKMARTKGMREQLASALRAQALGGTDHVPNVLGKLTLAGYFNLVNDTGRGNRSV